MRLINLLVIAAAFLSHTGLAVHQAEATVVTAEDMSIPFTHEALGVSVTIPHTWTHDATQESLGEAIVNARHVAAQALGISKEAVREIDGQGRDKSIVLKMHATSLSLPAAQITTRAFAGIDNPPRSAVEHLTNYMRFISNMTPVVIVQPITETTLNRSACAHVAYHTSIVLDNYTYLARYDVYSFWRPDRTLDLTIIDDRDAVFKNQNEMDIQTVLNTFRLKA